MRRAAPRHAASAFITGYVLEGAIRSQVNDGRVKDYQAGESFTENPGDRYVVSADASVTAPAGCWRSSLPTPPRRR